MNTITKKLLLEIISFLNTKEIKEDDIYLKKAYEKVNKKILLSRLGELLLWIDPKHHFSITNLEKYIIYEDFMDQQTIEEITGEYLLVFKYLPELKKIFVFENKYIKFNSSLNKNDIQEIYHFVEKNYIINPKYTTRYIRPKE